MEHFDDGKPVSAFALFEIMKPFCQPGTNTEFTIRRDDGKPLTIKMKWRRLV